MGTINDPENDDRKHGAIEAPDRIEGCAVSGPREENRHEDEHTKQLHSLVTDSNKRQDNKAPIHQLTNRFCVDEVVKDAVKTCNVIKKTTIAMHRRLNRRRVEEHGQIEGDPQNRGHNRDPFQSSLQSLGVRTAADGPSAPRDPDHPEAVGEEEKTEATNRCEGLDSATVDRSPFQALDKLLNPEEERHQGERLVIRPLMTGGQMMRIKTKRNEHGGGRETCRSRKTHARQDMDDIQSVPISTEDVTVRAPISHSAAFSATHQEIGDATSTADG